MCRMLYMCGSCTNHSLNFFKEKKRKGHSYDSFESHYMYIFISDNYIDTLCPWLNIFLNLRAMKENRLGIKYCTIQIPAA